MAVSVAVWLRRAGRSTEWYEALPADQKARVDASVQNTPGEGSIVDQLGGFGSSPGDIAREIDQSLETPGGDIEGSEQRAGQTAKIESDPSFDRFLSDNGFDKAWYNTLTSQGKNDVRDVFVGRSKGITRFLEGEGIYHPGEQRASLQEIGRTEVRDTTQEELRLGRITSSQQGLRARQQEAEEEARLRAQAKAARMGVPSSGGRPARTEILPYPDQPSISPEDLLAADKPDALAQLSNLGQYDPFDLSDDFEQSIFVLSGSFKQTYLPGKLDVVGERTVGGFQTQNTGAFVNAFATLSAGDIRSWQKRLVKAGYIEDGKYTPGYADNDTLRGMQFAIVDSQRTESTLMDTLRSRAIAFQEQLKTIEALQARARAASQISLSEQGEDRYKQQLLATYLKNWGTAPPPGYIEGIARSGMNFYEFDAHERSKPSFSSSPRYQMDRVSLEQDVASWAGSLG